MFNALSGLSLILILVSGYWMISNKYVTFGKLLLSSDWGIVGLALGASLMVISTKAKKK